MATVTLLLRGDQIGRHTGFSGTGNGPDRVVTVSGVEAVGEPDELFTVLVEQVNPGTTQFQNGQFVTISDADGNVILPRTSIQPDIEQGRGAGDEHLLISNPRFLIDLGGVPVGPATTTYSFADEGAGPGGDDDGNLDFADFPCLAPGTAIRTPGGARDVADLTEGDLIETAGGVLPIAWVGRRTVAFSPRGRAHPPILIRRSAFGPGMPGRDTIVSPDHRILMHDPACTFLFGVGEVLAPAKALTGLPGLRVMGGKRQMDYVSVFTARHEIVDANGLPVETLYPGDETLRRLTPGERRSLCTACPAVGPGFPPARRLLTVSDAEALVAAFKLSRRVNRRSAATRGYEVSGLDRIALHQRSGTAPKMGPVPPNQR